MCSGASGPGRQFWWLKFIGPVPAARYSAGQCYMRWTRLQHQHTKKNPFRNSDRASDPKVRDNLHHPSKLDGLQLIVWSPGEDGAKRRELTNKIRSDFGYRTFGFVSRECVCICAPKPFRRSLLGHCSLYVQPNIHAKILIGRAPSDQKASKLCIIVH